MPRWTNRASGPTCSARLVRKAMTSCFVSASIASIRAMSNPPRSRTARAVPGGTAPISSMASQACASISNQMRKRFSGSQIFAMAGRE